MIKFLRVRPSLAGVSLFSMLYAAPGHAQTIDYGALEQMFGEPVTTSVTGSPQRASEVPTAMTIVTQDDIRRSGADNLPDVLQFVTGIDIRRYSFGQAEISVRGYDQPLAARMLVLLNGRQVYLDNDSYVDWNAIPVALSEIRQIEVIKGPNSALFGFNAAAGVINIITYDPIHDSIDSASALTGTQHLGEGEAVGTGHIGKTFGVRVSVAGFTASDFSKPAGADIPSPRNGRLNVDMKYQVTPGVQLHLEAGLVDNRDAGFVPNGLLYAQQNRTNDVRAGATAETALGQIGLDAYRNEDKFYSASEAGPSSDTEVVRVVRLSDLAKPDASDTLRAGIEYRDNSDSSPSVFNGTVSYADYAASLMWQRTITQKLSFIAAGRIEYVTLSSDVQPRVPSLSDIQTRFDNTTLTEPTFNLGAVYAATARDTIRLSAGRGLQIPSLFDLGFQLQPAPGVLVLGSPSLRPTSVWNVDLGYDRDLSSILSSLTVDGFAQRNTDLVTTPGNGFVTFGADGLTLSTSNIGSSNELGLEVGIKGKSTNGLRWNASYRLSTVSQDIAAGVPISAVSEVQNGTPTDEIILGLGYSIAHWEFDLNGRWQSSIQDYVYSTGVNELPVQVGDYVTFAGRIGYDITRNINVAVSAQQFNVTRIVESAGEPVERRVIASLTVHL